MAQKTTPTPAVKRSAYAAAGVNIDSKMGGIRAIKDMVALTATPGVAAGIGGFGGLFAAPGKDMLLVASTDGVGTKLKVAVMAKRHTSVGQCLVNHCVNDILVQGAKPLFFLDYIGASNFNAAIFKDIVSGLCKACKENGCALLGGETAELPGIYPSGEYDLVGTIVGCVPKRKLVNGQKVKPGDTIIGLPSYGLQTNGYSLARKVIFDQCGLTCNDSLPGTKGTVADHLLSVHRSFLKPVSAVMEKVNIHGMAHITGGGFTDNIPRVLPAGCDAVINRASWTPGMIFNFIQREGRVDRDEMYRVFNMGLGFLLIVDAKDVEKTMTLLGNQNSVVCGKIVSGKGSVVYEN